jgi:hypothetical protein
MGRGGRRALQRASLKRKAFGSMRLAGCVEPNKVRYDKLGAAVREAARRLQANGAMLRPYPCGRHYHLTSRS